LERGRARRLNVPVCLSRLFPVGEEGSSFVHDVHGLREREMPWPRLSQQQRSARACRLAASHSLPLLTCRWIFSRKTTESLLTRHPFFLMTKTSPMKTKLNPLQRCHHSLIESAATKFTCSQSRMPPVAARCECDCVIESPSRRALMRISTSVTFKHRLCIRGNATRTRSNSTTSMNRRWV
jgi:hypothetical protein